MKRTKKRFDLNRKSNVTNVVDCLECENYYTGACDSNAGGCNAYTPTRKIRMEEDISDIKRMCKALLILSFSFSIEFILMGIIEIINAL